MMHGNLTASETDLAAKKAASNRGRDRGGGPGHTPKNVGFGQVKASGGDGRGIGS